MNNKKKMLLKMISSSHNKSSVVFQPHNCYNKLRGASSFVDNKKGTIILRTFTHDTSKEPICRTGFS